MAKQKSSMQKQVKKDEVEYEIGEQTIMFDLVPEDLKEIEPTLKQYRKIVKERVSLIAKEKELKEKIKEFAHSRELKKTPEGNIKFKCHDIIVEIIPADEKVKITEEDKE